MSMISLPNPEDLAAMAGLAEAPQREPSVICAACDAEVSTIDGAVLSDVGEGNLEALQEYIANDEAGLSVPPSDGGPPLF